MERPVKSLALCNTSWKSYGDYLERKLHGVETGIKALDRVLMGLSELTVVQGAPKCHKSTLILQIAYERATQGHPVLMFDRENGKERTRTRLLCVANFCSPVDILAGNRDKRLQYIKTVQPLPIHYTRDLSGYDELKKWIVDLLGLYPGKTVFVAVDSLQKLPLISDSERLSMQTWMQLFESAAKEFEGRVNIICTSEKSRGEGGKNYDQSSLSAAKGAGAVEYTAAQVLDLRKDRTNGGIIVEVVANRDGQEGAQVSLKKVFTDPTDESSFCFRLE